MEGERKRNKCRTNELKKDYIEETNPENEIDQ